MKAQVLGSAAGGGFPQWNCGCPNCRDVRLGAANVRARTQESMAVSADGMDWFLLNASPDIHRQIQAFPPLWPSNLRGTPIAGIVLTNGDMDHCLGLLSLRESQPLTLYATASVMRGFTEGNPMYRTLQRFPGQVTWKLLQLGGRTPMLLPSGKESGLSITAVPVPGKRPVHLTGFGSDGPEDNIGILLREQGKPGALAYFPAVGGVSSALREALEPADAIFFDGTFWSEDEMPSSGAGKARARDMAHWPTGGADGSIAFLSGLAPRRRILTHINNTNPLLREDSPQRAAATSAGVEIAADGLKLSL